MLRQWGTVIVPYSYFNEMDMKVTVIMEKASDGYYSCFVEENLPDFGLAGYGDTAEAAKKDMMKAYEENKGDAGRRRQGSAGTGIYLQV